ncbi:hypothetical protein [Pontibacillus litoralis]|uniref:Uncharacterized protein n=1 Tax=Pontibacillus litoralis JSM 072002 TaxID=1385512 RepID=A0A0A5HVZ0_9BACI|nr:hypothetical protein [Pontibacillus litoralis]KGX87807.1 hypothetical protein N784_13885 [Pontibacillus litoralis JSM 072002]
MSEKKKIIKVDDLIIYADNVVVEHRHGHHHQHDYDEHREHRKRPFDDLFGRQSHTDKEVKEEHGHDHTDDDRPPFSWV